MTAPSVSIADRRRRIAAGPAPPSTGPARLVEAWLRGHTAARLPVPVPADRRRRRLQLQRHRAPRLTDWDGFGLRWYEYVLNNREIQRYLVNSFIVGLATAVIATFVGTMAALGLQRTPTLVPAPVRRADLHERHRPGAGHRHRDARLLREHHRARRDRPTNATGIDIGFGYHTIVERAGAVQHQPRAAPRPRPADRHGPHHVEASYDLFGTPVADLLADHLPAAAAGDRRRLPAVVHVRVRRLPDHHVRQRSGHIDAAALRVRPDPRRRHPVDQRGRVPDAADHVVHPAGRPVLPVAQCPPLRSPGAGAAGWPASWPTTPAAAPRPGSTPARVRAGRPRTRAGRPCRCAPRAGRGRAVRSVRTRRSGGRSAGAGRAPR